jgi:N-acetylglucosamine-6-sulfatase
VKRLALLVAAATVLLPAGGGSAQDDGPSAGPRGPNVIVVMTDDQRVDDMPALPKTRNLIGDAGVTFTRYFASYPVCCPARATFFTGQYAHNHDVRCLYPSCGGGYGKLNQREYLPVWLERAGYATAHVGKFLNGYGKERPPDKPNGWTEWFGLVDPFTYRMWGYQLFENGDRRTYGSLLRELPRYYQTEVLTSKATQFIRRRAGGDAPFFLSVAYLAPHHESGKTQRLTGKLVRPAPRDRGRYAHVPLPKHLDYNESDLSDKPRWVLRNRAINSKREAQIVKRMHERWASLPAVDRGVEAIINTLRDTGELDNTYVIFTSDHGFMQGEHRIPQGKMVPYDPSTQVPLLIRGPGIPRNRTTKALVGDVDLAATVLDAAGARASRPLDGSSMLPYARNVRKRNFRPLLHTTAGQGAKGHTNTREGGTKGTQPRVPAWSAVRTTRWLYVEYRSGQREMYDLKNDRWEINNVITDPRSGARIRRNTMRRLLGDLERCRGRSCDEKASVSVR